MAQHDFDIANATGAQVRTDLNASLKALATLSSGGSAPAPVYPFQLWIDTSQTPVVLKQRNGANQDWLTVGVVDQDYWGNIPKTAFPNLNTSQPVNLTSSQLNQVAYFSAGTRMVFYQQSAPAGWTQITDHDDAGLRVVSDDGGGFGGSVGFSSMEHQHAKGTLEVQGHALTVQELPPHTHAGNTTGPRGGSGNAPVFATYAGAGGGSQGGSTGDGEEHSHGLEGGTENTSIDVKYVDVIICQKNAT